MEDSTKENLQNVSETKDKQQESSTPEIKYTYYDASSSESDFEFEFTCEVCDKTFSGLKPLRQHEKGAQHLKRVRKKEIEKTLSGKLEDDLSETREEDLEQTLFAICKTCKKDFMGPESLEQHLKSSSHHKKMAASKLLKEIKDKDGHINFEKLTQKRKGQKSKKNFPLVVGKIYDQSSQSEAVEQSSENGGACGYSGALKSSDDSSGDETIADTHEFECLDCNKVFTGVNPWYQHIISKVHEKTLKQKELFDKLRIAGTSLSNDSSVDQYLVQEEDDVIFCRLCNVALSGPESARTHLKSKKHTKNLEMKKWKKAMRENREAAKSGSKMKKKASFESSIENKSEMGKEIYEQHDTESNIDRHKGLHPNEEFSLHRDQVSDMKINLSAEEGTYLECSNAASESSDRKDQNEHMDSYDELKNQLQPSLSANDGLSKEFMSQDKNKLLSFQETYI